jgi:hypothetical protein
MNDKEMATIERAVCFRKCRKARRGLTVRRLDG